MENQRSVTSLMSSFGRAFHAENEEHPVFRDFLARQLMTEEEYRSLSGYVLGGASFFEPQTDFSGMPPHEIIRRLVNYHIAPNPLCRSAYTEGVLKREIEKGTEQYVILGAGLDTFAFREKETAGNVRIFEVDHPFTQEDKRERIARAKWEIPSNLRFVPVDFSKDNLKEKLINAGFDRSRRTFFSWLGVTCYLSAEEIGSVVSSIADLCGKKSLLAFDFADDRFFLSDVRRVKNTILMAQAGGEKMKSCFSDREIGEMLASRGFAVREILSPADIGERVIPSGSDLLPFEHFRYCLAEREDE